MTEARFHHTLGMTAMAVSLAQCHGIDQTITWKTAMLHDVAKDLSREEMLAVAAKYGHEMSRLSLNYQSNMHAEVGALIAEHEFGLDDQDALNAIRFHFSARPDMSTLEKIIYFSDSAEPSRPNQSVMRALYDIAKTDLDHAILRELRILIEYQLSHDVPAEIRELCTEAFDFLLEEYISKRPDHENASADSDMLSDDEFDEAFKVLQRNRIALMSVENARRLTGFIADGGRRVRDNRLIRSGSLQHITAEEEDYLKNSLGLSLVIDLRTPSEVEKAPDRMIPGIRHENIPLAKELNTTRMEYLTQRYLESKTEGEKSWFAEQYARINEVMRMYRNISTDIRSRDAIQRIFRLLMDADGAVLIHCTSGKDRTGIISALILYALGCGKKDIVCDYTASAVSFFSRSETVKSDLGVRGYDGELKRGLQTSISVVPEVLSAGFYYIDENYSSIDSFILNSTGLDRSGLELFRNKFLE